MVRRAVLIATSAAILSVHGGLIPLDMDTTMVETPAPTPTLVCSKEDSDEPLRNTDTDLTYVLAFYGAEGTPFAETDDSILWPYSIDKCTAIAPIAGDNLYGMFTCSDDDESFTFTKYQDKDCTTMVEETTLDALPAPLEFNCVGNKGESYAAIDFYAEDSDCGALQHTYGTVGVCGFSRIPEAFVNNGYAYLYCDADGAKLEFFDLAAGKCGEDGTYCADLTVENSCNLVFTTATPVSIYGKTVECTSAQKDDTRDDDSEDAAAFTHSPTAVALFASFSVLFAALV